MSTKKVERPALLELLEDWEQAFPEISCDTENCYIWLSNYEPPVVKRGFEVTRAWYDRKKVKNELPKNVDVYRYATSVMRNIAQARKAVAEILGDGVQ
jgi:hypothetical protein